MVFSPEYDGTIFTETHHKFLIDGAEDLSPCCWVDPRSRSIAQKVVEDIRSQGEVGGLRLQAEVEIQPPGE